MAEFRKCFDNLDTEKRGVITIEDLKNYMFKMHYKETFLHKWIELFDPEHTGFITYEQYCKTLGLIPRKRTLSKDFTDSTLSSSSSLSVSSKQDNINEVSIGSFDKHVDQTNITTVIQQPYSNEPQQTIEQLIITEPPTPQQQTAQTIKDTCPLQQSEVEIIETEQQQQQPQEFSNQPNSSIHQNINIESINLTINDEKLNIRRKRKYIDENQMTIQENIISPVQNDILLETTELIMTDITNSNHNENQFIESLKEINNEINNLSDQLNISSQQPQLTTNQTMPNIPEKKSIKKSKRKQKYLLSLETKTLKQNEEMTIDTKMIPSDNEHNELLSSIIIPMTNNYEIQMTDITYTTTTTITTSSNIPNEISSIQFNINNDPIDQSSINHKHKEDPKRLETKQTSHNKEIDLKKQYETTSIQPSNYSLITTESTISISTDSGHSEASDVTLSSVEIPIKKEEEDMLLYDSNSLNILQNDNEMPTSTLLSTESNQFNEYCLSNETNQEKDPDLHHDNQISNQTIKKSNKKSIKKKQKPNTPLEQIIDPINSQSINLINQSINQQSNSTILPKTDINNSNDNLLITDNQSISELLIIPQNIQSISRSPQGMNEEIDADHTVELLSPKKLVTNGKKFKKYSKNSKKKHEKINDTINSNSDYLQVVNTINVEMISEHRHEEDINPSVIENQSDKINISCSDTTFPELNSIDPQSECIIEQVPTKQNIVILEVNNPSEQILNESQIIISNDNIPTTELTYTSSKVPIDDHYITSEYIEEVQFNNINNNNNNGNDTLVDQSSLRKDDVNEVITEMTLCDLELNIELEDTNKNLLKQSKEKRQKTKEPTEKNIKTVESHQNTTNTCESTSFEVSSIPQSTIITTDASRTVESPLSTDVEIREQTLQPTISKKKHKKTKEPTEKNIQVADNHENTTNTSELTSFQESFIPQSAITTTDVSRTVDSPLSTDLQTKEQTLHPTISKKKHKKTKEPTEKNITAADNHENTTNTSELTSFQESFIPQSTIKMTDVSRTVDSPLSIDVELREQTLQPTKSMTSSDLVSQPSDGFSKKPSRNRKTKKGKTQSDDNHSSKSTPAISPNSLIPVDEVHSTVYNISSSSNSRNIDNNNNFTSLSIPFCKTICKVSHEELQNSLSHRSTSSLKVKNKKHHLKSNKLKNSETNILDQMDDTLNDEMAIGQSSQTVTEEETQENTRKRRFPKSFLTQVDPRYNRSVRLAAKRRKTDSTHKAKEASSSSTDKRKTTIQQKSKQIIKKWHIRPSLRENGVIVILLAGRHRGKRVVSLGQHKSTGLLLVTGPYCYNGCPLRRIHPDYVIATKTKIDLSSLSLPERIHTKKYFTRSTTCKKFKKSHQQNRFADILDHGVTNEQSTYQPNNEKKMDQIYIDNEVRKAIKCHSDSKLLIGYLKSLFSIGKYDKPHEMLF
ncbi:unnamed protein product [Schistosoma rodhaini]|nr:unnamed protein product [Schistosoma rodhaini]